MKLNRLTIKIWTEEKRKREKIAKRNIPCEYCTCNVIRYLGCLSLSLHRYFLCFYLFLALFCRLIHLTCTKIRSFARSSWSIFFGWIIAESICLTDNSREQCCPAIANEMPAIRSVAREYDEWLVPTHSRSRTHLLLTTRDFLIAAASAFPSHVRCTSKHKISIRSESGWTWKC